MAIITRIDEYFTRSKVPIPYPSVLIESKNVEALPVLLNALEPGDVSVIFEYGGKFNVPKQKISHNAVTLAKLLQVYPFTLLKSQGERYEIKTAIDILEAGEWSD